MPELPEVETITRALAGALTGCKISAIRTYAPRLREPLDEDVLNRAAGHKILSIRRRAKFIILTLSGGILLVIHLGMTGVLRVEPAIAERRKHDHVEFDLSGNRINKQKLVYHDPRRFGLIKVYETADGFAEEHADLGLEPLEDAFSPEWFYDRTRKVATPIKTWIMKQDVVVGVGNIYACEALHYARLSPTRPASSLSRNECARLVTVIKEVLQASIAQGGTTFSDYRQLNGEEGHFVQNLKVYGRVGERCQGCKTVIQKIVQGGRSTFFCPHCQV